MVVVLYSDKNYEYQVVCCLRTLERHATDGIKFFYVTVGFDSEIEFPNLTKSRIEYREIYPSLHYYKPEVCLMAIDHFQDEDFIFTDTDVVFSHRFKPTDLLHSKNFPLAGFGEHEYPYIWEDDGNGEPKLYDESTLLRYFGGTSRTQRYVLSCFFTFNRKCKDFLEEWFSMCSNKYLLDRRKIYFPFPDETSFNVCLWKRNITENLGFVFLNTNDIVVIKEIEKWFLEKKHIVESNKNWLYLNNATDVLFYHGLKNKNDMEDVSTYIQNI